MTAVLIALVILCSSYVPDAARFAIADLAPAATTQAAAMLTNAGCVVFEDLSATCEGDR